MKNNATFLISLALSELKLLLSDIYITSFNCAWWQSSSHPLYCDFCWLLAACPHVLPAVCSHFIACVCGCANKYTDLYMTWVTGVTCEELNVTMLLTLCCDWMPTSFWCCILRGDCESVILMIVECMLHIWVKKWSILEYDTMWAGKQFYL
jgi:hypothetical protein